MRSTTWVPVKGMNLTLSSAPKRAVAPAPAPEARRTYAATAPHIRGRVTRARDGGSPLPAFVVRVTNTATGAVLVTTDAFGLEAAIAMCSEIVAMARAAWFWSLDGDLLKAAEPKSLRIRAADAQAIMTVLVGGEPYGKADLVARLVLLLNSH